MIKKEELHHYCIINELAYNSNQIATAEYIKLGYTVKDFINVSGVQCFVLLNENELLFVFRGTDERKDILADTNAFMVKRLDVDYKVHRGFHNKASKVQSIILKHMNSVENKFINFTGHSYGGALALLIGSQTYCNNVITFGSPRVGDKKFKSHFWHVTHYRVRNNMDIVTKIPFSTLGYRHHGTFIYLDYFGNIIENPSYWQLFKDAVRSRFKAWSKKQLWDGFYDHYLSEYKEKLK